MKFKKISENNDWKTYYNSDTNIIVKLNEQNNVVIIENTRYYNKSLKEIKKFIKIGLEFLNVNKVSDENIKVETICDSGSNDKMLRVVVSKNKKLIS